MPENYYLVLELSPNATISEIKNAYRKLAKKFHPDRHGADCSPFLTIQEAYSVLSDPARKKVYDLSLQARGGNQPDRRSRPAPDFRPDEVEPLIPEKRPAATPTASSVASSFFFPASPGSLFDMMTGIFSPSSHYRTAGTGNPHVEIHLTTRQALQGGRIRLRLPALLQCPSCGGREVVFGNECRRCFGHGVVRGEYPVIVQYPPGVVDNSTVRLPLHHPGIRNGVLTVRFRIG